MRLFALIGLVALACALSAQTAPGAAAPRIVVAVVDSGVSPTPQLAGRLLKGWNFVDNNAKAADLNGHGTIMASIVAAQCPRCAILPVRVLGSSGLGTGDLAIAGIRFAVAHGANVINLSMNTPSDNPALSDAVEAAVAAGVTVVLAAGNSGAPIGYPAASAPDAIAVGSVDATGHVPSWSNYGPWVTVLAPATIQTLNVNGRPVAATGTSGSAAFISGTAGRLLFCRGLLAPAAVRARLQAGPLPSTC